MRVAGLDAHRLLTGQLYDDYLMHVQKPQQQTQPCLDGSGPNAISDTARTVKLRVGLRRCGLYQFPAATSGKTRNRYSQRTKGYTEVSLGPSLRKQRVALSSVRTPPDEQHALLTENHGSLWVQAGPWWDRESRGNLEGRRVKQNSWRMHLWQNTLAQTGQAHLLMPKAF